MTDLSNTTRPACRPPGPGGWRGEFERLAAQPPRPIAGPPPRRRRIVVPLLVGASDLFLAREGLIGHALRLRGADVLFALCDGLPACDARTHDNDPAEMCRGCAAHGADALRAFGHRFVRLSELVDRDEARAARERAAACPPEALFAARLGGAALGDFVFASTLRYFRAGAFEADDPAVVAKAREYLAAATIWALAARALYRRLAPSKVFSSHGIYSSWGPWHAVARAMNVPYASYSGGWRRGTLLCRSDEPRAFDCDDIWPRWADRPLNAARRRRIEEYLGSREDNRADFYQYFDRLDRDAAAFAARLDVSFDGWRRRVGVFTNVAYDAARPRAAGAFPNMFEWLTGAVARAARDPRTLVIVKTHPAERRFIERTPGRWSAAAALRRALDPLPPNVRIVDPDDNVSTRTLYGLIDLGLVYTSSVGLEMAAAGLPVLTPGTGVHYEKPGIVLTAADPASYFAALDALLEDPASFRPDHELLLRYAYTLYFRKSIPFEPLDVAGWEAAGLAIDDLAELAPGRFPGLDALCEGILNDAPFEAPDADETPGGGATKRGGRR